MPPRPRLSDISLQLTVEPHSPEGLENVKRTPLYWCIGRHFMATTWHNDS